MATEIGFIVYPDYLEDAKAVVKHLPVHRYSVDIFSCSGPSGILGSDGKRKLKPVLGGVIIVALSISSHEQRE